MPPRPRLLALLPVALLALSCGTSTPPPPPAPTPQFFPMGLTFHQLDYVNFAGFSQPDTAMGAAVAAYDLPAGGYFLNFVLHTLAGPEWQIQNLPVWSGGTGEELFVPLDFTQVQAEGGGPDVPQVEVSATLSDLPLADPPDAPATSGVSPFEIVYEGGVQGTVIFPPDKPIESFKWEYEPGKFISWEAGGHSSSSYTNQDCGVGECAPAAISNSLRLLGAGSSAQNDIASAKGLTDWDVNNDGKAPPHWADAKKSKSAGAPYDVNTDICLPGQTEADRIKEFCDIVQDLRDGKDVEADCGHHVGMVVAAFKLTVDGRTTYHLEIAHDVSQGQAGGAIVDPVQYDPKTNKYSGGTPKFFDGATHKQFVTESKK